MLSTEKWPHEDTVRKQLSANQGERPQKESNLWHLGLQLPASRTVRKSISVV